MIDEYKSRASKRKVEIKQQEKSVQSKKKTIGTDPRDKSNNKWSRVEPEVGHVYN